MWKSAGRFASRPDQATAVVGISSQSVDSHEEFSAKHRLNVPLLSDPGGKVAKLYSAYTRQLSVTRRAVIVIDEQGVVRHRHDHLLGLACDVYGQCAVDASKS